MSSPENKPTTDLLSEVEVGDKSMSQIFGHNFWNVAKKARLFHPYNYPSGSRINGERTFYTINDIVKAVVAYTQYNARQNSQHADFRGVGVLIKPALFDKICEQPWWKELTNRFSEYSGCDFNLADILKSHTIETRIKFTPLFAHEEEELEDIISGKIKLNRYSGEL